MQKIRWGIIGCGNVTEVKSGPGFQLSENSELIAVMRRDAAKAEDYARRHQVPRWYRSANDLIKDNEVDAVYIATPPDSHLLYAQAVAAAGKPVYVEKPMGRNFAEAQQMVDLCKKARVPLFVAHYRRGLSRFNTIRQLVQEGSLGEVRAVNMTFHKPPAEVDVQGGDNWRVRPEIAGCGYFCDLAPHMIDIIQYICGPIEKAAGQATNLGGLYEAEDTVSGYFRFASGAHGSGLWNFNSNPYLDRTEIIGTKGKISFAIFGNEPLLLETKNERREISAENPRHIQQPLIQTIVDQLLGRGLCPSTGDDALSTYRIMDLLLGRTIK